MGFVKYFELKIYKKILQLLRYKLMSNLHTKRICLLQNVTLTVCGNFRNGVMTGFTRKFD